MFGVCHTMLQHSHVTLSSVLPVPCNGARHYLHKHTRGHMHVSASLRTTDQPAAITTFQTCCGTSCCVCVTRKHSCTNRVCTYSTLYCNTVCSSSEHVVRNVQPVLPIDSEQFHKHESVKNEQTTTMPTINPVESIHAHSLSGCGSCARIS